MFDHYEAHGTAILRMLSQEDRIPAVRDLTDRGRDYHRDWASRVFEPLLAGLRRESRERRLTAVVIATDVLVWKLLRLDMQLSRRPGRRDGGRDDRVLLDAIELRGPTEAGDESPAGARQGRGSVRASSLQRELAHHELRQLEDRVFADSHAIVRHLQGSNSRAKVPNESADGWVTRARTRVRG